MFRFLLCISVSIALSLRRSSNLDGLRDAVGSGRVDLLAGLVDLLQDGLVGQVGVDNCGLLLKRNLVAIDAWKKKTLSALVGAIDAATRQKEKIYARRSGYIPSSFLRTRSMAPEQPPQVMVTSNW